MYGCAQVAVNEEELLEEDGENESVKEIAAEEMQQPETNVQTDNLAPDLQLYITLATYMEKLGVANNRLDFYNDGGFETTKLVYAELVDFNADGQNELFILAYSPNIEMQEAVGTSFTNEAGYVYEVWQASETEDVANRVISGDILPAYGSQMYGTSLSFLQRADGTIVIKDDAFQHIDAEVMTSIYTRTLSEIKNGQAAVTTLINQTSEPATYSIDGEEVEEATYLDALTPYDALQERKLISENEAGYFEFQFTLESSAQQISDVLRTLNASFNPPVFASLEVERGEMQALLEEATGLKAADVNDPSKHADMLSFVLGMNFSIWEPVIEKKMGDIACFAEADVAAQFKRAFGIALQLDTLNYVHPDDKNAFSKITYDDGCFYYQPEGIYFSQVNRNVTKVYEIATNMYYVELLDDEFDWYAFEMDEYTNNEEMNDFVNVEPSAWSDELAHYARSNIQRYAIVKMIDGEPTFPYVSYRNLMPAEIELYK